MAETTVFCEIMNLQIQGNSLILSERRVMESEKNCRHALSKADKEFLWSSGSIIFGNDNNSRYFSLPFFNDNSLTEQCSITTD